MAVAPVLPGDHSNALGNDDLDFMAGDAAPLMKADDVEEACFEAETHTRAAGPYKILSVNDRG